MTNDAIEARLDGLRDLMYTEFGYVKSEMAEMSGKIDTIHEITCGNGEPGHDERIRNIERVLKACGAIVVFVLSVIFTALVNGWI